MHWWYATAQSLHVHDNFTPKIEMHAVAGFAHSWAGRPVYNIFVLC